MVRETTMRFASKIEDENILEMKKVLEKILKDEIAHKRGFETLLNPEDMRNLFEDYQIDEEVKNAYFHVITNPKNVGKLIGIESIVDRINCRIHPSSCYTRFEKARIIGARALQISYGAPILIDYPEDMLDPIDIATMEYEKDLIPITIKTDYNDPQ